MKLDTANDRLQTVQKLFRRAGKINDSLRKNASRVSFGDVLGLMVMSEKLVALEDLIKIEILLSDTADVVLKLQGEDNAKQKFETVFAEKAKIFLEDILLGRLESMKNFADNDFSDRKLANFQTDFKETMTLMLDRYREVYKI